MLTTCRIYARQAYRIAYSGNIKQYLKYVHWSQNINNKVFRVVRFATMAEVNVDDVVDVYRTLSCYADIKSGVINNKSSANNIQVSAVWSQRDLDCGENISFMKNYHISADAVLSTQPVEITKVERSVQSGSGQYTAVLKSVPQKTGEPKQFLEVWSDNQRLHNISVESLDEHGKIYDDSTFGCLEWSASEDKLLFIAERKKPKAKSYFEQKSVADDGGENMGRGEEYVYEDDWGEQLTGKVQPLPCILDVKSCAVTVLDCLPPGVSAGPAVWCTDDLGIVCIGTFNGPFRLGRIYCPIRRTALFHIDINSSECTMLGSDLMSVHSPVFSPDNSCFAFLENEAGGTHTHCSKLKICKWSDKSITIVIDIVRDLTTADQFPGLFALTLPRRCWSKDSKRMVIATQWRSKRELVVIHCEKGTVMRITSDAYEGSWNLLDLHDDVLLAAYSSPSQPPCLLLAHLPGEGQERDIVWFQLDSCEPLHDISWEINSIDASPDESHTKFSSLNYEYIIIKPSEADPDQPLPMIVFPHGGPHSVLSAEYMLYLACFCRLGYLLVCVNYRGSFGFGEESIQSLPGHVGTCDVHDVQMAAEHVIRTHKVDEKRVFVMGGSHGGFITGHLIGQHPGFYRAAVMRNPVVNIASMTGSTDIPDWNHVETGITYSTQQHSLGTPDMYTKAWHMSPIKYVNKVKTPVLLVIGQKDRRVPNQQAHEYRKALMAHGAAVKMLTYAEDCHPIIKVPSEADCFVNIVKWFREHSN